MGLEFSKIADIFLKPTIKVKEQKHQPQESFMDTLRRQFDQTTQNLEQMPGFPKGVYGYGDPLSNSPGDSFNSSFIV